MNPEEEPRTNGDAEPADHDDGSTSDSGSDSDASTEEWTLEDGGWPARALAALNALRKARQHYDVLLAAEGRELPAHRAVLAAAAPRLLAELPAATGGEPAVLQLPGVAAGALQALLEYMYTGRLSAADAAAARALYTAAWRLRADAARAHLAARLTRRRSPRHCLLARALPGLSQQQRQQLDAYLAEHFEELCSSGALSSLPVVRVELLRETSAADGSEAPPAVAAAALQWLKDFMQNDVDMEEVCSRVHLLYVDAGGALRDCGALPEGRGDAPELSAYRRAAAARAPRAPAAGPQSDDWAVIAARRAGGKATSALLALGGGGLAAAHLAWREGSSPTPKGGALGAVGVTENGAGLSRARAALGLAVQEGRLLACGGYDRTQALKSVECFEPSLKLWRPIKDMRSARARFPAASLNGHVYALGGSDGLAELDSVEMLSENGTWTVAAKMPVARSHAAAAVDEEAGQLYVLGGWNAGVSLRAVHKYTNGGWSEAPSLLTGRSQFAAVCWEKALWALGGCDAWHCLASTEMLPLDGSSKEWRTGPPLPTARRSMGGAAWRGALWAAGGSDGACSLRRCDWLRPTSEAWSAGPQLRQARAALGLAVLDDVLYAVGGFSGKEFLSSVECLSEEAGEWTVLQAPSALPVTVPVPVPLAVPEEDRLTVKKFQESKTVAESAQTAETRVE